MGSPIEIPIASETKAFRMGIESGVIDPLEDAEKALLDLGHSGDKTSDELDDVGKAGKKSGKLLDDALTGAQRESDKTRNKLEQLADQVEAAGRSGRSIDDGIRKGTEGAGEAVKEFGDEAKQNMAETFASFRGDGEDLVQIVQDTFGGVMSNLGPVGMAAGAAGAIGIGLIIGAFEKAKEEEADFRERVAELAADLIEHGGEGAEGIRQIADGLKGMALETDEGKKKLAEVVKEAKEVGVSVEGLAQAYAGSAEALDEYGQKAADVATEERELARLGGVMADSNSKSSKARQDQIRDYSKLIDGVSELKKEQEAAAEIEAAWIESGGAAMEARADRMEALQGELDGAIGKWSDYYDAETGATDPAAYLNAMQARIDATANFNTNVNRLATDFGMSSAEVQAIIDQGVDFAPMLQSIIDSGMGDEYVAQVRAAVGGGQDIVNGNPLTATVDADADTSKAEGELDAAATDRDTTIKAKPDSKAAAAELDAVAAKSRTATIRANADTSAARAAIDRLVEARSVTIRVRVEDQRGVPVP